MSTVPKNRVVVSRRAFLSRTLQSAAAVTAGGLLAPGRVLGANERIRIGLIGAGSRGQEILRAALRCPNVEGAAVADVYTRRLEAVTAAVPGITAYRDFRRMLDDPGLDAVLIATPQHQHALNFVPAIQARKDVYQEKTMAFNPDHAKRMRQAFQGSGRVVQIGMQMNSGPGIGQVIRIGDAGAHGHDHRPSDLPFSQPALWRMVAGNPFRL